MGDEKYVYDQGEEDKEVIRVMDRSLAYRQDLLEVYIDLFNSIHDRIRSDDSASDIVDSIAEDFDYYNERLQGVIDKNNNLGAT